MVRFLVFIHNMDLEAKERTGKSLKIKKPQQHLKKKSLACGNAGSGAINLESLLAWTLLFLVVRP